MEDCAQLVGFEPAREQQCGNCSGPDVRGTIAFLRCGTHQQHSRPQSAVGGDDEHHNKAEERRLKRQQAVTKLVPEVLPSRSSHGGPLEVVLPLRGSEQRVRAHVTKALDNSMDKVRE